MGVPAFSNRYDTDAIATFFNGNVSKFRYRYQLSVKFDPSSTVSL